MLVDIEHTGKRIHTDSKSVCAEWPNINENPRIIVAKGTKDASVFSRLKMSKQTKMMNIRATASRTASSLATADPTSYEGKLVKCSNGPGCCGTLRLATSDLRSR